jgi:hypothetical protein
MLIALGYLVLTAFATLVALALCKAAAAGDRVYEQPVIGLRRTSATVQAHRRRTAMKRGFQDSRPLHLTG